MYQKLLSRSGFSLERLAGFCAVADAGSIAAVAPDDPNRQSLLSRQIRELESFFAVELIRRKGRGLELTAAGRELAAVGRENFKGLEDFTARCEGAPSTARIVASNSVASWLVLPRLPLLAKAAPRVFFEIHHEQSREMVAGIREGTYDVAFVTEDALAPGIERQILGKVGYSFVVAKSLVRTLPAGIRDLARVPMALPVGGRMRSIVDELAVGAGFAFHVTVGCSSYLQAALLATSGECATVLPDLALDALDGGEFHYLPVPHHYRLCLAWSKRSADTRPKLGRLIGEMAKVMRLE